MKCQNCGYELEPGDIFCQNCGSKQEPVPAAESSGAPQTTPPEPENKQPEQSAQPEQPSQSAQTEQPIQQTQPAQTEQPAQPAQTDSVFASENTAYTASQNAAPAPEAYAAGQGQVAAEYSENYAQQQDGAPQAKVSALPFGMDNKTAIIAAAAVAAFIIIVILCFFFSRTMTGSAFITCSDKAPYTVPANGGEDTLVYVGTKQIGKAGNFRYASIYSFDCTTGCFITKESSSDSSGDLYCCTSSGVNRAASDVSRFSISASGNSIIYISDGNLYLYGTSSKKTTRIADDVGIAVVSPDGKTVAYTDDNLKGYIYSSGKITETDIKGMTPICVSDGGKYFYYAKNDSLYVYTKNDSVKISGDFSPSGSRIQFNRDCTEMLFSADGKVYISVKGGEKHKLSSDSYYFTVVHPSNVTELPTGTHSLSTMIIPVSTFDKKVIADNGETIRFITRSKDEWTAEKIASNVSDGDISENGKKLAYVKNHKLYVINDLTSSLEGTEMISDVSWFEASGDLSEIYYISTDDELRYLEKQGKSTKISDDVNSLEVSRKKEVYFTVKDTSQTSILYYTPDKQTKKKVDGGGDTSQLIQDYGKIFFESYDGDQYDLYVSEGGAKFTCISKDYR